MRVLTPFARKSTTVQQLLDQLSNSTTTPDDYRNTFYRLGTILSEAVIEKFDLSNSQVTIACSSEDADWLTKGIIDNLTTAHTSLAVFWNLRANPFDQKDISIAPITKSYIEEVTSPEYLIVIKSIIYTSCVIRTNLTYLIEHTNPKKIIIASPIIFYGAEETLKNEFPKEVGDKFSFVYFATDNEVNGQGEVVPGIGGSVYERLGIGNGDTKNKYIPNIVKTRRATL
jgi:uracil phosphoribosyltransferase